MTKRIKAIINVSDLRNHLAARRAAKEELSYAMDLLQDRKDEWKKYLEYTKEELND